MIEVKGGYVHWQDRFGEPTMALDVIGATEFEMNGHEPRMILFASFGPMKQIIYGEDAIWFRDWWNAYLARVEEGGAKIKRLLTEPRIVPLDAKEYLRRGLGRSE